jgi:hypothetical protein
MIFAVAVAAVASITVAAVASAKVDRNQPAPTSATFELTSPMTPGDWSPGHLWIQDYTVSVNPDGAFVGTGHVWNQENSTTVDENVTGSFTPTTVSLDAVRPGGFEWSLTNAPFDGTTQTQIDPNPAVPWVVMMKVSTPVFTGETYKNHGDYVSSQGGGSIAAQSPIGMPVNGNSK